MFDKILEKYEEILNKGFKLCFFFCYSKKTIRELEAAGIKAIVKGRTLADNRFNLYWKTKKLRRIIEKKD